MVNEAPCCRVTPSGKYSRTDSCFFTAWKHFSHSTSHSVDLYAVSVAAGTQQIEGEKEKKVMSLCCVKEYPLLNIHNKASNTIFIHGAEKRGQTMGIEWNLNKGNINKFEKMTILLDFLWKSTAFQSWYICSMQVLMTPMYLSQITWYLLKDKYAFKKHS